MSNMRSDKLAIERVMTIWVVLIYFLLVLRIRRRYRAFLESHFYINSAHFWPIFPFYTLKKQKRFFGVFREYKL